MIEGNADVRQMLNRYVSIQRKMTELETEKKLLRDKLQTAFPEGHSHADSDLGACKVVRHEVCEIEYNETLLRERLGDDKYRTILTVDWKRVRENLDKLEPFLLPAIDVIGIPSAEKVKAGIESGDLDRSAFAGAFIKKKKILFAVSCKG